MKLVSLLAVALAFTGTVALAQKGQTLMEGETVLAANVKTGAQFLAVVRGEQKRVFFVSPEGTRVPMTKMLPLSSAAACTPGWSIECHQDASQSNLICFCVAGDPGSGGLTIDTTAGEIRW